MDLREVELPEESTPWPKPFKLAAVCCGLGCVAFLAWVAVSFEPPDRRRAELAALELELQPSGKDDHPLLRFARDVEPLQPRMQPITAEQAAADKRVVGIVVGDEARAFVLHQPKYEDVLVASTLIAGRPIVLAHNYLLDQTRVLTGDGPARLDVRFGGQDHHMQMVLLFEGVRYLLTSNKLPLEDYPFEVTTLARWFAKHPQTLVSFDEETRE